MNQIRKVYAQVVSTQGETVQVSDQDGTQHTIRHDRPLKVGDRVQLVLFPDGSPPRVLEVPRS